MYYLNRNVGKLLTWEAGWDIAQKQTSIYGLTPFPTYNHQEHFDKVHRKSQWPSGKSYDHTDRPNMDTIFYNSEIKTENKKKQCIPFK